MHRTTSRLSVLATAILAACASEGEIGSEQCVDNEPGCEVPIAVNRILSPSFEAVSTEAVGEARITDTIPLPCAGSVFCAGQLLADDAGGVWTMLNAPSEWNTARLRFTHHDAQGMLRAESEVGGEDDGRALDQWSRPFLLPEGGIALGTTWRVGSRERPDSYRLEVLRIDDEGNERLRLGQSEPIESSGSFMPKTRFSLASHPRGFVASFSSPDERVVRLVDDGGTELWRRGVPRHATDHFSVLSMASGFVLPTRGVMPGASSAAEMSGFLWYDQDGRVIRHVFLPGLGLESTPALALADGRLALASVITMTEDSEPGSPRFSDLYVMRVASDGSQSGHRLRSESAVVPSANALARDDQDTLYVSTMGGKRSASHPLVCVLPEHREPACHSLPDGTVFHSLAAVGNGVIYGLSENALVRIELD
jgi:hypothetical protein